MISNTQGSTTTGPLPPPDYAKKDPEGYTVERARDLVFSKGILKEKIKQFKLGKYTEKYIKTYLDFILMEGIIDNLEYLEFLKEIGTN
jgi:hypothetical protein